MFCGITFNSGGLICSFCLYPTSYLISSHSYVIEKVNLQMQLRRLQPIVPLSSLIYHIHIWREITMYSALTNKIGLRIFNVSEIIRGGEKKYCKKRIWIYDRAVLLSHSSEFCNLSTTMRSAVS